MEQNQKKEYIINNLRFSRKERVDIKNRSIYYTKRVQQAKESIPKRLYKYRECNDDNVKALECRKAWFSNPNQWPDKIDFTISFNLEKDANYVKNNFREIILKHTTKIIMPIIESLGYNCNLEMVNQIKELCFEYIKDEDEFDVNKFSKKMECVLGPVDSKIVSAQVRNQIHRFMNIDFINQVENGLNNFLAINKLKGSVYMCSLSETYDNDKQWDEYAKHGEGFCIGYTMRPKDDFQIYLLSSLLPIIYDSKKSFSVFDWVEMAFETFSNDEKFEELFMEFAEEVYVSLYTKKSVWSGEEEWRFRIDGNGGIGELVDFDFAECIYLGENIKPEWEKRLIDIAKTQNLKMYRRTFDEIQSIYKYIEVEI